MTTASHTNGRAAMTAPLVTGNLRPRAGLGLPWTWDRGRFTRRDVPAMLQDTGVQFVLKVASAPVYAAKIGVTSADTRVANFVGKQLRHLWDVHVPLMLQHLLSWGSAGGEANAIDRDGALEIGAVKCVPWQDRRPWVVDGEVAGVNVTSVPGAPGKIELRRPGRWFWLSHGGEDYEGWPFISGCWSPWMEKTAPKGYRDSRRLYAFRHAFGGDKLYYPVGQQNVGGSMVSNADFADGILAARENGASISLPGDTNEAGKRQWELEDGQPGGEPTFLMSYGDRLDAEYFEGCGISMEVVKAADTGSGWAGRSVPFLIYLKAADQVVGTLVRGLDACLVRPLVDLNFGASYKYEVVPKSLVPQDDDGEEPKGKSQSGPDAGGGPQPPPPPPPPGRQTPPAQLAADAPADDRGLADLWAEILSGITTQGEEPDEELLDLATEHLQGGQWVIVQEDDGTWEVRHASEVDEEPVQLAAEKAPKGGITLTNRKGESKFYAGGRYIPAAAVKELPPAEKGKLDAAQAAAAAGKAGRVEGRQARGSVDVAALKAKLAPHAQELDRKKLGNAKRAWAALRSHHGELALHRVEELHDALQKQLERYAGNELMQEHLRGQMAKLNAVADMAAAAGVTGAVEKPAKQSNPLKDTTAFKDRFGKVWLLNEAGDKLGGPFPSVDAAKQARTAAGMAEQAGVTGEVAAPGGGKAATLPSTPGEWDRMEKSRPVHQMTRQEREAEASAIRSQFARELKVPLMSDGEISPMQVGMMSPNQREKYTRDTQIRMRAESRLKRLEKPESGQQAERAKASRKDAEDRISQIERHNQDMHNVGTGKDGKLKPKYQREVDRNNAELQSIFADHPDLAPPPAARPAATAPTATPAPAAKSGLAESAPMPEGNRRDLAAAGSTSERIKAASSADVHTLDPLYGTPDWEVMGLGNNEALRTLDTRYHSLKRTRDSGGLDPKRYREDAARINGSMDDTAAVVRQAAAGLRKVGKVAAADWYERHGLALVEEARKDLLSGQKGA